MDWFKAHADSIAVIAVVVCSVMFMNSKLNDMNSKFNEIEKDITVIKTVLVIKQVMPNELACKDSKK